eukprot:1047268-Pyramimonas_sp.AAC.1
MTATGESFTCALQFGVAPLAGIGPARGRPCASAAGIPVSSDPAASSMSAKNATFFSGPKIARACAGRKSY